MGKVRNFQGSSRYRPVQTHGRLNPVRIEACVHYVVGTDHVVINLILTRRRQTWIDTVRLVQCCENAVGSTPVGIFPRLRDLHVLHFNTAPAKRDEKFFRLPNVSVRSASQKKVLPFVDFVAVSTNSRLSSPEERRRAQEFSSRKP